MKIGSIVIRCFEFEKMLAFWQQALGYVPREPASGGWVVLRDPRGARPNISLDRCSQPRVGKRSRLHLDLYTNDREKEVARLVELGAVRYPWRYRPTLMTTSSASYKRVTNGRRMTSGNAGGAPACVARLRCDLLPVRLRIRERVGIGSFHVLELE